MEMALVAVLCKGARRRVGGEALVDQLERRFGDRTQFDAHHVVEHASAVRDPAASPPTSPTRLRLCSVGGIATLSRNWSASTLPVEF
jgi:hypothetical protein